ncbi:jg13535 [Pararge aegeria aegeria]|uniref:Jg13535 protein n=2 Tax=Pararge aegeria TaxID=116150 RepID=A0A8S4S6T7_9NEOP|nr:jg13535 [Pararge aegeria aegeria]
MQQFKCLLAIISCLLVVCFGEVSIENKDKFLNGFVEYLNNLPDQIYTYDEGVLLNAQKTDEGSGCYYIEARLRVNSIHNLDSFKYQKCFATIQDLDENGITIRENQYQCEDVDQVTQTSISSDDTLEDVVIDEQTTRATVHEPIHLDNEVQPNSGVTSGEEFIAVPRKKYSGTCIGCSSHVNPQAPGVSNLAELAIKHLDRHEPTIKHSLQSVLDVERQVQVVNGVRYTLTLQIGFNNCTSTTFDTCYVIQVCKVSILEKTWIKLPDGSKYRAILSNNCTQEWIFGDEGEYIPNNVAHKESNDIDINPLTNVPDKVDNTPKPYPDYDNIANTGSVDEMLKAVHNTDTQAQKQTDQSITEKELKELEEQIIPHDKIYEASLTYQNLRKSMETPNVRMHQISEFQRGKPSTDRSFQFEKPKYEKRSSLISEDRKKAIDDLINFFNSAGIDSVHEHFSRVKRSYEHQLKAKKHNLVTFTGPYMEPNQKNIEYVVDSKNMLENSKVDIDAVYFSPYINNNSHRKKRALSGKKVKQDPNLPKFKLLAQESLRKYQKRQNINESLHHDVTKVEKVDKQLVSGTKYSIDFIAKPLQCIQNEQKKIVCNHSENDTLYCHTSIWKRPWKGRNKIEVNCNRYYDLNVENHDDYRKKRNALGQNDVANDNYISLAKQTLAMYQRLSNAKYIYKIIKIHHVSQQDIAGTLTTLEFSISPTKCLVESSTLSLHECNLLPQTTVLRCQAEVLNRPWIKSDKDINIDCKEQFTDETKSGEHNEIVKDAFEEDVKNYYANRAVKHINDKADTNNIQKLITIHAIQNVINMGVNTVRMYIETAYTYCIRHQDQVELAHCVELSGMHHRLCYVRLWPSPDDELVIESMAVVCDDEPGFKSITGISVVDLIKASLKDIEASPKMKYKLVHQGELNIIPSLDSRIPIVLSFIVVSTNCSKYVDIDKNPLSCYVDTSKPLRSCTSSIWLGPNSKKIKKITSTCGQPSKQYRSKRSLSLESTNNITADEKTIQNFVKESLEKLEMSSLHKYKQRVLQINSYDTKIVKGRLTTIDFDVGYTTCLKYEWVDNITQCEFIDHLPRRHCISQIQERLWLDNGKKIDVNCKDDDTPLEATIEFESAENAMQLATEALKHIEAKYPHPRKQKVVRIFSLDKQEIAGVHYRMKLEVGYTDCLALSVKDDCKLINDVALNKFCRANIWVRPWTEHPPTYRVSCDYQDGITNEIYHKIQTEHLFSDFLATYKPDYINDHLEMLKRYEIFHNNVRKIHEFNTHERGTARYAVTRFSDLTYEEFGQKYLGLKPNLRDSNQIPMRKADIPQVHLPNGFDWRHYNAVTEVKNQGSCGSCWAFSVTGNIEGQWKMQSGNLVSLSEQELVDCDKLDEGCNGGLPDNAYRAIEQLGGLETENDYPYEGENDKCAYNKTLSRVQISGAVNISSNETDMAKWLVKNGPISIGINANAMQFYVGGVSHPWRLLCSPKNLDHGVLIVGYGVKDYPLFHKRLPYWIIKNSWGSGWGEQGYYRVYRGDGTCGVNQMASSAVI